MKPLPDLPVTEVLPDILSALEENPNLALVAPPGAGKTTLIPLALLEANWREGKRIIVLEPRRLAARSAAARIASLLDQPVGQQVGYRVRFDTKVSKQTIIEVVTEGVFTRILTEDPGLETVAAVLFDEFHERSLDGDLALALCLDLQTGLREDLRLMAMSATLDGAAVADVMKANIVESAGRAFPVEIEYRERPPNENIEFAVSRAINQVLSQEGDGSLLVFLPGMAEIRRVFEKIKDQLPQNTSVFPLYGALSFKQQDEAIRPPIPGSRKIVLTTAIAETSLTIEGIDTVIDSGLSRQPVYEPATGLTRLHTVRASQAAITQRAGRAGRLGPGRAIRLWREEQTAALPKQAPPEIINADLTQLLLDLADWGVLDVNKLRWLDVPPVPALNEARKLLISLGALNQSGAISSHGKAIRRLALPPRLADMVLRAAKENHASAERAALLALLTQERGVGGHSTDLAERQTRVESSSDKRAHQLKNLAKSLVKSIDTNRDDARGEGEVLSHGVVLGFAFPDRIAQRTGQAEDGSVRFRLANGRGAQIDATDPLSREEFLVVVDMAGRAGAARILSASALEKTELRFYFADRIEEKSETSFDPRTGKLDAMRVTKLGAINLTKPVRVPVDKEDAQRALLEAVRNHGLNILPWQEADKKLRGQFELLHGQIGDNWPDVSDEALLKNLDDWLAPFLSGEPALSKLKGGQLSDGLMLLAGYPSREEIQRLLPSHFDAPSGSKSPLNYEDGKAVLRIRPQELFGLDVHPSVMDGKLPLTIELLSPAGRPIQITDDLPGFWRGTWADMRSDMRGRYPKHPWPEQPLEADPTKRAKPRKK